MAATEIRPTPADEHLSERTFRMLADTIPHMVWSTRPDGQDDYFNRRLHEYTGMTHEQLKGRGWLTVVHPEDLERCQAVWNRALAQGTKYEIEYRLRRRDGQYRWHLSTAEPLREGGRIVRWFGTSMDIEERKRAERVLEDARRSLESEIAARTEALRSSEARFRRLTALSSDWYWEQDEQLRFTFFSESLGVKVVGAPQLGVTRWELGVEGVSEEQWAAHRAQLERHEPFADFEYWRRLADGSVVWRSVSGEPIFDADGRFRGYRGVGKDITQRKRMEIALRTSENRLREIIRAEPECVKLLDAEGRLLEMNPAGLGMIEADALAQVLGQCIYGVVVPEHREAFRELTERVCRGERGTLEFELQGLKGTRRWMQTHAVPFVDEARKETLLLAITRDISSRKRAERALEESEQRFRTFMDSMPVIAWVKDSQFRYTWVNEGYRRHRGRKLEEILGHTDLEVHGGQIGAIYRAGDLDALRRNAPVQSMIDVPGDQGLHLLAVRFPLPDATGAMGVGGIAIDISERVELERALRENEKRIVEATETVRQLMSRLVHAQEAERHKLAGDLHDLIGQKLTALGINLEFVRQRMPQAGAATLAPRLHQISTLLEETIGSIREVMSGLRPQVLDEHGLSAALYQYASVFEARTGLRVQVQGAEARLPLPREVAIALFRIAQEALTNAAKHSGASRAVVRVRKSAEHVELHVEDDGRGMAKPQEAANGGGWGLPMMRERAEAVGGLLRVESARPGTRIAVVVPLARADQRHPG